MIDHITLQTEKIFKGTTHEQDWMVYHDALSLFVANESYKYMRRMGFYEHLIVPLNRFSTRTPYTHRMVGM